jgi:hypothetical protein
MSEDPISLLERELVKAAKRQSGQRDRTRRVGAGRMLAALGTGLVAVITLGIAAAALVLVGGAHKRAAPSAAGSSRQQLIDILGVLRRPQTKADLHSPGIAGFLGAYQRGSTPPQGLLLRGSPDIPLIRRAAVTPWGSAVFVIPMKPAPAQAIAAATRTGFPQASLRVRRSTIFHQERVDVFVDGSGGGGAPASSIETRGVMLSEGAGRSFAGGSTETRFVLLVPDGVAKVELYFPAENLPAGGPTYRHTVAVTVPVRGNVAAAQVNRECCSGDEPALIWYAADGTIVKRIGTTSPPPTPPRPAPPTPLSRAAERNPATPNRVSITPAAGGPASSFAVKFRVLLNDADYQFRGAGPSGSGCQSALGDITGGGPSDVRGRVFTDTFRPQPGHQWCPGTYRVTVAAYDLGRAGVLHHPPQPFGAATFTVRR